MALNRDKWGRGIHPAEPWLCLGCRKLTSAGSLDDIGYGFVACKKCQRVFARSPWVHKWMKRLTPWSKTDPVERRIKHRLGLYKESMYDFGDR